MVTITIQLKQIKLLHQDFVSENLFCDKINLDQLFLFISTYIGLLFF